MDVGLQIIQEAQRLMQHKEFEVAPAHVLRLAAESGCSAYDCEFVSLAARYADFKEVEFSSEPGVRIRARLLSPKGSAGKAPVLIYVKRPGDSLYALDLDELLPLLGRATVVILNPRVTEHPVSAYEYAEIERSASWIGRTVASMQAWDILRAIEWLSEEGKVPATGVSIYGKGDMGIVAIYAGLLDPRVNEVILNDPPGTHWQRPALLNVLRVTDIPEVAGAFAPAGWFV